MASSINRSSHRRCSLRKGVLRNFAKFTGKHPWATTSEERRFFKLAPNKSVKTACVFIAFFFYYFRYGQNIFSRITVLYLIAKLKEKKILFI